MINPLEYSILNDAYVGARGLFSGILGMSKYGYGDLTSNPVTFDDRYISGLNLLSAPIAAGIGAQFTVAKGGVQATESVIKGFTKHATDQAITRGFKTPDILKIVREGNPVQAMGRYGAQTRYVLGNNTVIVNAQGKIVTVFSNAPGTRNGLGKGFFIPFE